MDILSVFSRERVLAAAYNKEEAKAMAEAMRLAMIWIIFDWEAQDQDLTAVVCPLCNELCQYNVPLDNTVLVGKTVCVSIECISRAIQKLGRKMLRTPVII